MPVVLLIVAIDMMGFGIIIPMLPFYAESHGGNPQQIALLMTTFSAAQLVMSPLWGGLSDRWGRKPILLSTFAGGIGAYLLLLNAESFMGLVIARAVAGAMAGNLAVAQAYIADVTAPEDRTRGMGLFGAALSVGFVAGPAVGGVLAGIDPSNLDFSSPLVAAIGVSAIAWLLGLVLMREPERRSTPETGRNPLARLMPALTSAFCAGLVFLYFGVTIVLAGMESTFALWSERVLHWGPLENGYLFAGASALGVVVQGFLVGRVAKGIGNPATTAIGIVLMGLGMGGIAASTDLVLLIPALVALVFGLGFANPALAALIAGTVQRGSAGAAFGVSQSAASLARIIGPAVAGAGFHHVSLTWPYTAGAVFAAVMAVGAVALFRKYAPVD